MRKTYSLKHISTLGFTLIELTLVIFFMALIAGLSTPFIMSTLDRMELQTSARKVASTLRYARSEAIASKKPVVFLGNLTQNQYGIDQKYRNKTSKMRTLTDPVRLTHFRNKEENNTYGDDGEFTVTFFPQGNSSGGLIGMDIKGPKNSKSYYAISIDPITGSTKIKKTE